MAEFRRYVGAMVTVVADLSVCAILGEEGGSSDRDRPCILGEMGGRPRDVDDEFGAVEGGRQKSRNGGGKRAEEGRTDLRARRRFRTRLLHDARLTLREARLALRCRVGCWLHNSSRSTHNPLTACCCCAEESTSTGRGPGGGRASRTLGKTSARKTGSSGCERGGERERGVTGGLASNWTRDGRRNGVLLEEYCQY